MIIRRHRIRIPDDGISVRLLLLNVAVADGAAAAGAVDDRHRYAERFRHAISELARRHVGRAAGAEHHRHLDRLACWKLLGNRRHRHHHQRRASRSSNGPRYHTHSLPPPRFTQNPLSLSMLESEWMCSRRPPAESNPQCTPPFLSRAAIERPDETQGLLRLTLTHQASTHWRAHSFPIACRNHGSRVHFFRLADPARIRPHPEEPCVARRLEGWPRARPRLWPSFETPAP